MKILHVKIFSNDSCGGLLDGFECDMRRPDDDFNTFQPLCLVGPNGSGKSQFLQALADIFQSLISACSTDEEPTEGNPDIEFEIEYMIRPHDKNSVTAEPPSRIRARRKRETRRRPQLTMERYDRNERAWKLMEFHAPSTRRFLPEKIVGYTSGDNETLSRPFLRSQIDYASRVTKQALKQGEQKQVVDPSLMLIDYSTNLEVLVANLLYSDDSQRYSLLKYLGISDIHSFRCVIQLNHSVAPTGGVQLTEELKMYIDQLRRSATCWEYNESRETYTFDYWVDEQTKEAFRFFWKNTLNLYASFHKLAMLNILVIPDHLIKSHNKVIKGYTDPKNSDSGLRWSVVSQ